MQPFTLLEFEKTNGTERLTEAFLLRGFLVKNEGDFIVFKKGSGARDICDAKMLLDELNIPVFWKSDRFQLLTNRFPISLMKRIIHKQGREYEVRMNDYHYRWKFFAARRFGFISNALDLDPHTAILVKALNLVGVTTLAGCNGHLRWVPNFQFLGAFNGAWFEVIQQEFLRDIPLHYVWKVGYENRSGSSLFAQKQNVERWGMKKLLEDCVAMAQVLEEHAAEIRSRKQRCFKRKKIKAMAEELLPQKQELVKWMMSVSEQEVK